MNLDPILLSVITMAVTGAAAFGGVKVGLNGAKDNIKEIDRKLTFHMEDEVEFQQEVVQRLTAVETKLEK